MPTIVPVEDLFTHIGKETGISDWFLIDQERINAFAETTEDRQFIHIDPEKAKETAFGGTVAHGFLTLSMISIMWSQSALTVENRTVEVNYGMNKVRLMNVVHAGDKIRGKFFLKNIEERPGRQFMLTLDVTIEIEGKEKPALKAEWLNLQIL